MGFNMRFFIFLILLVFTTSLIADEIIVPHVFKADKRAIASEVNENFSVLAEAINSNEAEIEILNIEVVENRDNIHVLVEQLKSSVQSADGQSSQIISVAQTVQNHGDNIKVIEDEFVSKKIEINSNKSNIDANSTIIESNHIKVSQQQATIALKQNRMVGGCEEGSSIRIISTDGTVVCEFDSESDANGGDVTAITVGNGLLGGATSGDINLAVDTSIIQKKLKNATCSTRELITTIMEDGAVICSPTNGVSEIIGGTGISVSADVKNVVTVDIKPRSINNSALTTNSVDSSKIQNNAINSSSHIVDEPGITTIANDFACAHIKNSSEYCNGISLALEPVLIASVTVDAPNAGLVLLNFSGNYYVRQSEDPPDGFLLEFEISESDTIRVCETVRKDIFPYNPMTKCNTSYREIIVDENDFSLREARNSAHSQLHVMVPSKGTYTYYIYGKFYSYPEIPIVGVREHSFTAMYFPTSY